MRRMLPVEPLLEHIDGLDALSAAHQLGVSDKTVTRWRTGQRKGLTIGNADRYACALGLHPGLVWGDAWWDYPTRYDRDNARNTVRRAARAAS
jgi:plasmid maintenance system antidote protein VapI